MDSALSMACAQTCCCKSLQVLLEHGADPTQRFVDDNATVLHQAAGVGQISHSTLLLAAERGAAVNTGDATGITPLDLVVKSTVIAAYSLEQGADPHAADLNDCTPLHYAAFAGSAAVVNLLLEHGADDSAVNGCGRNALASAVEEGHINVVKLLVTHGVDVNTVDICGKTLRVVAAGRAQTAFSEAHSAALRAFSSGSAAVTELLLTSDADVHATDSGFARTALETAAGSGANRVLMGCANVPLIKLVLSAGADVHMTAAGTVNTALHQAVVHRFSAPVVRMLIKAGADLHAVNKKGRTAADIAHDKGYSLMESLLLRAAQG
eukprot:1340-Heterococcus_DN1.PRE.13